MATQEAPVERPETAHPVGVRVATVVQGVEAVAITAGTIAAAVVTADGRNFQLGNEIGLTLVAAAAACGLAAFTVGLHRVRPWSRTPVVLTQLLVGGIGLYLIGGHRWGWGVPALLLALICLVGLFTPASVRALNRPPFNPETEPAHSEPAAPQSAKPPQARNQQARNQQARNQQARNQQARNQQARNQQANRSGQAEQATNQPASSPRAEAQPAKSSTAKARPTQNRPAKKAAR
jgi:pyruvate/2-oxoglutarate dehydrogenase complex dihydrolipoamide acyltransferase (E2) component